MLDPRRHQLLDAMGIDVWVTRSAVVEPQPAVAALEATPARAAAIDVAPPSAVHDTDAWDALRREVSACRACVLHEGRQQTVFGVGDTSASLMVIGEAPGAEEDRRGEPFVGRAGQLLNAMLAAIGFAREQVFIANIVKCRPPRNRDPEAAEAAACSTFLTRQIELLQPRVILAVGRVAAQQLLRSDTPIGRMRGQVYTYGTASIPLLVTYHPAYLLRSPAEKRKVWQDLQALRALLAERAA